MACRANIVGHAGYTLLMMDVISSGTGRGLTWTGWRRKRQEIRQQGDFQDGGRFSVNQSPPVLFSFFLFFFSTVEISSHAPIPLFQPESVLRGSAS